MEEHPIFDLKTLPGPLKTCFEFLFRCNDNRRKNLIGTDGQSLSAVDASAKLLPGPGNHSIRSTLRLPGPDSAREGEGAGEEDQLENAEEEENPCPENIPMETHCILGWRTSYRTQAPENLNRHATFKKLQRQLARMAGANLPDSGRASLQQTEEERAEAKLKKKENEAAVRKFKRAV